VGDPSDPCPDRGDYRQRSKYDEHAEYRNRRYRPSCRPGRRAEGQEKGHVWRTEAPCCGLETQVGKKATPAKKAPKGAKAAKTAKKESGPREGVKTEKVLDLLKRSNGATLAELIRATGWQPHSVRGFLSGTIGKKLGLALTSTKAEDGERSYSIKDRRSVPTL
jgi:Protein of unknown function (DUF3489)